MSRLEGKTFPELYGDLLGTAKGSVIDFETGYPAAGLERLQRVLAEHEAEGTARFARLDRSQPAILTKLHFASPEAEAEVMAKLKAYAETPGVIRHLNGDPSDNTLANVAVEWPSESEASEVLARDEEVTAGPSEADLEWERSTRKGEDEMQSGIDKD